MPQQQQGKEERAKNRSVTPRTIELLQQKSQMVLATE